MRISVCRGCGRTRLEEAVRCGHCGGATEAREVSGRGTLYSFSTVWVAPPGTPTPYLLALVELEEGGRVLARLEADEKGAPAIGDGVAFAGASDAGPVFRIVR